MFKKTFSLKEHAAFHAYVPSIDFASECNLG